MAASLLWIVLFMPAVLSFRVKVEPKTGLFRVGSQESVVCTVEDCAQTPEFTWGALQDKPIAATIETAGSKSIVTYKTVEKNDENRLLCRAKCGEQWKQGASTVKVYEFPDQPNITGHERLVLGEPATLTCNVSAVYPGEETGLEWHMVDEPAPDPVEGTENTLVSSYRLNNVTHAHEGRIITCRAWHRMWDIVKKIDIQTSVTLTVLYAPGEVQVSGAEEVEVGETLSLRCSAEGRPRPQLRWRFQPPSGQWEELEDGEELVVAKATHGHAGQYQCVANNTLGERHTSINVSVQGPPRSTNLTMSPVHPIREGESVTFSCRTLSVPVGTVRLLLGETEVRSAEGSEVNYTLPAAQLDQAGLYRCVASNQYGTHTSSTQLTVTAPPRNTTVEVFPSQRVMEGENITICCRSVSFPLPVVTLTKLGNATEIPSHNGTFVLTNLMPSDGGEYQVNVTNDLGFHTQVFTISVMEKSSAPSDGWEALLIPAVVMGSTLASAALLLDFVLRSRKKGSYKLAKSNPSSA